MRSLLVANRGEIACRVMRTARSMGLTTVAVFSDADADAVHVAAADLAVRLPGHTASETYLQADAIVAAAVASGADAAHPGYGFLSENAAFARAVIAAGLTWVGPPPEAIEAMGSKLAAKQLMRAAGVPTLPWATDPADVADVGFPLLVKASAGGGGRGMRVVRRPDDLAEALAAARREAGSAFGDDTVFLERWIDAPRHIEVQIFADRHGACVSLFERECSIQRRHQKVVEEAPSPAVSPQLRAELGAAAVAAARAVDYVGAGTVEFVLDAEGRFFFLEMNTRLQVEHPVTEAITGLDLVRLQLLVASGQALPDSAAAAEIDGHAIEVRLYAEDPRAGWMPQTGTLRAFEVPGSVRCDSGVAAGSVVSPYYDPMLAKVVSHAATRGEAAAVLADALSRARIHGVGTNRDLLVGVLTEPEFLAGGTDTAYFDRHDPADLTASGADASASSSGRRIAHAVAAVLARAAGHRADARVWRGLPAGWRNNPSQLQEISLDDGAGPVAVRYAFSARGGVGVEVDGVTVAIDVHSASTESVDMTVGGVRRSYLIAVTAERGDAQVIDVDGPDGASTWSVAARLPVPQPVLQPGALVAPMPGTVARVPVSAGTAVQAGDAVVVLEAMKMEHTITAAVAGVIAEVRVVAGQQVDAGATLAVLETAAE